jgi:cytoskeletal protein CcmA (bactofilin family)
MAAPLRSTSSPEDRQTINCLFCGKSQEVARRAMSVTCKFCNKSLKLEDIAIKQYEARRLIATCGIVTIEKKGSAITDSIKCGGLIVRGKVKGAVESQGPVLIGPEAEVKGDVKAPTLAVGAGAVLEGQYKIGWKEGDPAENSEPLPPGEPSEAPESQGDASSSAESSSEKSATTTTTTAAAPKKAAPPKPALPKRDPAKPSPFKTFPTKK